MYVNDLSNDGPVLFMHSRLYVVVISVFSLLNGFQ